MDERRRRYYLTALGIDPWCARWPLPGGAPSPEMPPAPSESIEPAKPEVTFRRDPASVQGVSGHGQQASLDAVRDALDTQGTPAPATAPSGDQGEARAAETDQSLNAIIWHDDRFSLIASAPVDLPLERPSRLGGNILRALGASGDANASMVRWPPFENPELPGNNADNFQRVLDQIVASATSGRWIILGADLHGVVGERFVSAEHEIVLAAEQTLGELLADPTAKRTLWEQMQPLSRGGADR